MAEATCRYCGGQVHWLRRPDGSVHPPLVPVGLVTVLNEDGTVGATKGFIRHRCNPADVERVQARQAAEAEEQAQQAREHQSRTERAEAERDRRAARDAEQRRQREEMATLRDQATTLALTVTCPKCQQPPKKRCLNLNTAAGKGKGGKHTSWPHPDRTLLADKEN